MTQRSDEVRPPEASTGEALRGGLGISLAAGLGGAVALALGDGLRMWLGVRGVEGVESLALAKGCLALGALIAVVAFLVMVFGSLLTGWVGRRLATWILSLLLALVFLPLVQGTLSGRWLRESGWAGATVGLAMLAILLAMRVALSWAPRVLERPNLLKLMGCGLLVALIWQSDRAILPKLYPDFHTALSLIFVAGGGVLGAGLMGGALGWRGSRALATVLSGATFLVALGAAWLGHIPGADLREQEVLLRLAPMNARLITHLPGVFPGQYTSDGEDLPTYVIRRPARLEASALDRVVPQRQKLNVLLITIDALRADALSCYRSSAKKTPTLDALAAKGVLFERAYATHPSSQLSLASLFKGRYPTGTDIMGRRNLVAQLRRPPRDLPVAALMQQIGRTTHGLSALPRSYTDGEFVYLKAGFDEFNPQAHARPLDASEVTRYGIQFLRQPKEKPFFLWLHYFDPHAPYRPHDANAKSLSRRERYLAEVQHTDTHLAGVLKTLEQLGLEEDTVVVLHSDHGEEFGEHGGSFHGSSLFEEQVRVPLIFRIPGVAGQRVKTPAAMVDVLPTLAELIGFSVPHAVHGNSLLGRMQPFVNEVAGEVDHVAFTQRVDRVPEQDALRYENWKLIVHRRTGLSELYDLQQDPGELRSVASQHPKELTRLRSMLKAYLSLADDDPEESGQSPGVQDAPSRLDQWVIKLRANQGEMVLDEMVADLQAQDSDDLCGVVLSQLAPYIRAQDLSELIPRIVRGGPGLKARFMYALAFQDESFVVQILDGWTPESDAEVLAAMRAVRRFASIRPGQVPIEEGSLGEAWLYQRVAQLRDTPESMRPWGFAGLLAQRHLRFDLQILAQVSALRCQDPAFPIAAYPELFDRQCLPTVYGYCLSQKRWIKMRDHAPVLRKFLTLHATEPEAKTLRERCTQEQFDAMESVDALVFDARDRGASGPFAEALKRLQSARVVALEVGYSDWGVWLEAFLATASVGVLPNFTTLDQDWFPKEELSPKFALRLRERLSTWSRNGQASRGGLRCTHWEPVLIPGKLWVLEVLVGLEEDSPPLLGTIGAQAPRLRVGIIPKTGDSWHQELPLPLGFCLAGESQPLILPVIRKEMPKGEYEVRIEVVSAGLRLEGIKPLLLSGLTVR